MAIQAQVLRAQGGLKSVDPIGHKLFWMCQQSCIFSLLILTQNSYLLPPKTAQLKLPFCQHKIMCRSM